MAIVMKRSLSYNNLPSLVLYLAGKVLNKPYKSIIS